MITKQQIPEPSKWKRISVQNFSAYRYSDGARNEMIMGLAEQGYRQIDMGGDLNVELSTHKIRIKKRSESSFDLILWHRRETPKREGDGAGKLK